MSDSQVRALARRLRNLERQVLQAKQPTLGFSSIDDGAITSVDEDGNLKLIIGKQFDGTQTSAVISGPTPPQPLMPSLTAQPGSMRIYWDGTFTGGAVTPMDFARVLVYAVPLAEYTGPDPLNQAIIVGQFSSPLGGELTASLDEGVEYAVYFVTWTEAGKFSPASEISTATVGILPNGSGPIIAPVAPQFNVTGMPRGLMVQVTNGQPGWTYTYTVTEYLTDPVTGVVSTSTQSFPDTARPLLYSEDMPDGSPMLSSADGYSFHITATNESGTAISAESGVTSLVLNDSSTIAELSVGKLVAGDLVGAFALLGALQVGTAITIDDDNGITIAQPNGGKIKFPANGDAADISAHLDAFSLTVRDRLKIQGLLNEITVGAVVALSSGVTAPGQPPSVLTVWKSTPFNFAPGFEDTMQGLVRYDANTWFATSVFFGGSDVRACDNLGNGFGVAKAMPAGYYALGGLTVIGTTAYVLCYDTNRPDNSNSQPFRWFVRRYNVSTGWTFLGEWEYDSYPNSQFNPTIGRSQDGTEILIARCAPSDGKPRFSRRDPATGTVIGTALITDTVVNANLTSVWSGVGDMTGTRYITSTESSIYAFDTTGTRFTAQEWQRASSTKVRGLHWDTTATKWYHLDNKGTRWEYGTRTSDTARSVAYSWYDSDSGGTGTHETAPGTALAYTQPKRAFFTVTTNPPNDTGGNDDPDSVRIWIGGQRQPDLGSGILTATYDAPSTGTISKAADFPTAATPALLRSAATGGGDFLIKLSGSGAWRLGDISGDVNGRVVGGAFVPVGGLVPFYGTSAQVPSGWLLCDGTTVSESTHPLLFAHLVAAGGTPSGVAPNRTVPRPDMKHRTAIGAGSARAFGATDGNVEADRTPAHFHNAGSLTTSAPSGTVTRATGTGDAAGPTHTHDISGSTSTSGAWSGANAVIPHTVVNWIIRAA